MKFFLLVIAALPVCGQLQTRNADFAKALRTVLNEFKGNGTPAMDLPEAAGCEKTRIMYACEWKSRANASSVSALETSVLGKIAAALPAGWSRRSHIAGGQRFTDFGDPENSLAIRVTSKATPDGSPPWDYTVRLVIEHARTH